jgi:hypothetical protein
MSSASVGLTALSAAGTGIAAGGQLSAGSQAAALGRAQAAGLSVQAGQDVAQGTSEAANQALQTKYIISNVRGAAGASGAVATSPDVVGVEGQIAARGSYSALSDMYSANEKAAELNYQGALDVYSGKVTQQADEVKALSTALSGFGSLASKYGGGSGAPGASAGPTAAGIAANGYGYM